MSETKAIQVTSGCIHYEGAVFVPGDVFTCPAAEADRLVSLGVVRESGPPEESSVSSTRDLLELIAAAATVEELAALMPEEEPPAVIVEALEKRMAELSE